MDGLLREVTAALGGEPHWAVASRSALADAIEAAYACAGEPVEAAPAGGHVPSLEAIFTPEEAEVAAPAPSGAPAGARSGVAFQVAARLSNGERVEVAVAADRPAAELAARAFIRTLTDRPGEWPLVAGRFLRLEAIVSVDVTELPLR
jgi:hypothetical protein